MIQFILRAIDQGLSCGVSPLLASLYGDVDHNMSCNHGYQKCMVKPRNQQPSNAF